MQGKRKIFSKQMLLFEFRKTIGNPYVHIFGVGMPVLMMLIITRVVAGEIPDPAALAATVTTIFLGTGSMIPMATIFMGYAVSHAQELEKGIPQRMELFGIRVSVTLCNRILSEVIFMALAFVVYFAMGYGAAGVEAPVFSGAVLYAVCIVSLSVILFCLAYGIASLLRKFGPVYCVTMLLYFGQMILGGMMGITYDNMPSVMQAAARMLPVTYITRDFYTVWRGKHYNFAPMLQAYLLMGAVAGIVLFVTLRRSARKLH